MIHILISKEADTRMLYLGHCPLSLAISSGQLPLVLELLSTGVVDPNENLGGDLGVPLCVMMLKKTVSKMGGPAAEIMVINKLIK